jgi:hypothetical protein
MLLFFSNSSLFKKAVHISDTIVLKINVGGDTFMCFEHSVDPFTSIARLIIGNKEHNWLIIYD